MRLPLIFWALVLFSLFSIALGVWWLLVNRAEVGSPGSAAMPAAAESKPASDFQLADLAGKPVRLSELRGKVVLLNFWATWCPPCKAEMPDLQAIYNENRDPHDFVVLGIDVEESREAAQAFARQYNLSFPLLPDPDGQVSTGGYAIRALPTSLIIDREGRIRTQWTGQQTRNMMLHNLEKVWR